MANTKNSTTETITKSDVGEMKVAPVDPAVLKALGLPQTFDAEEKVGFAPYWKPSEGKTFIARVIAKEEAATDADFTRYLMQAGEAIECQTGPADEAEHVIVQPGEYFTISVYYSLQGLFDFYFESDFRPWMKVTALAEKKTKTAGQTVWTWKVNVNKADKAKADQYRAKLKAAETSKQLGEGSAAQLQS